MLHLPRIGNEHWTVLIGQYHCLLRIQFVRIAHGVIFDVASRRLRIEPLAHVAFGATRAQRELLRSGSATKTRLFSGVCSSARPVLPRVPSASAFASRSSPARSRSQGACRHQIFQRVENCSTLGRRMRSRLTFRSSDGGLALLCKTVLAWLQAGCRSVIFNRALRQ
jgi:hypothetical protein